MHKELINHMSDEKIRDAFTDTLSMIKETNHDLYEDIEMYLYKDVYGCHFSDWLLKKALSNMENEDGTKGEHWSLDQTSSVARQNGITFDHFNEYDWCYVMNMIYSDYYGAVSNDTSVYFKMAKKFLMDKDAREGKALHYYLAMKG